MSMPEPEKAVRPSPLPEPREQKRGLGAIWFGWWVAVCLVVLAFSTYQQLAAQKRILEGSRLLEAKVGEAAAVSAATNVQLGKVAELNTATTALGQKLARIGKVNATLRAELGALELTVDSLANTVATLDNQALQSHENLAVIAEQSQTLLAILQRSNGKAAQVSGTLRRMVELQEGINADLSEMNAKTLPIDRLLGGG